MPTCFALHRLQPSDVRLARKLNALFAEAFSEPETYSAKPASDAYLEALLAKQHVIALVAVSGENVLGGLVAYELDKFETAHPELYIYDLAVGARYRRRGIATALIEGLRAIAVERGAQVVYVQADYRDAPAVALYGTLGTRREVLHFDIPVETESD